VWRRSGGWTTRGHHCSLCQVPLSSGTTMLVERNNCFRGFLTSQRQLSVVIRVAVWRKSAITCTKRKEETFLSRVSFETSFDSKPPKLEPKLVSALSKTNCLFRLFRFYTETESFDVSIEPKQTEDQPKQFEKEHIWLIFRKFRVVSVCFETVLFVSVVSI
jgi:hypothetical protein